MSFIVFQRTSLALLVCTLTACASVDLDQQMGRINQASQAFTQGQLVLAQRDEQRKALRDKAEQLLSGALSQTAAVDLMLANSPGFQALLAQGWAQSARAAQLGRVHNPVFSFERERVGSEVEINRLLSFGLLDLLSLPARQGIARGQVEKAELDLTAQVIDQVTRLRLAWVDAVAAHQSLQYAQQVQESAQASAELARRMQEVGNFNRLARARQHAFYADATLNLATAQHKAMATREALVRLLGLTDEQAVRLTLPDALPALPKVVQSPGMVAEQATNRLDVRMAKLHFDATAKAQGVSLISSFLDVEVGKRRGTIFENDGSPSTARRGYELDLRLPVFDWGGMQRDAMGAETLHAANRMEATLREANSALRQSYSAYRTTHDIARHYQDEILPLKKMIADENLLRYNGMFIGVFELLADGRDQVSSVIQAINAQADFWRAEAALRSTLVGRPVVAPLEAKTTGGASSGAAGAH